MNQANAIAEAERMLLRAQKAYQNGMLNIASTEADRQRYQAELATVPWEQFVQKAD